MSRANRTRRLAVCCLALGLAAGSPSPTFAEADEREPPPEKVSVDELERRAAQSIETVPVGTTWAGLRVQAAAQLEWQPLGPRPMTYEYWSGDDDASGRVSAIVVDPRDGDVVYVAGAQGGVWKTTDGGVHWTPLTDQLSSLASGALALDPSNADIVYYGTGEQHYSGDSFYGDGLFRSPDAGVTWTKIASRTSVGSYIARVAVSPTDPNVLYLASSRGFCRSADGGGIWTVTLAAGWCNDLVIDPSNSSVIYASVYASGIYKSVNGGVSFTRLTGGLPGSSFYRINLAIAPSNPQVLYASFVNSNGGLYGMYRTGDGGANWSALSATPNYLGTQGWYDNSVLVAPNNPNVCYAGGVFPYSSTVRGVIKTMDGGQSWLDITHGVDGSQVHPDQHLLTWGPDGTLWLGCDGGVWKSLNNGSTWINCNADLSLTQFYTLALHPSDPSRILGGTQDNGSAEYAGGDAWPQVAGGDGGPCGYEWDSPNIFYTSYVFLSPLYKWDLGSYLGDVSGAWTSAGDRADWCNGPLVMDPNQADQILAGTYRVWRSPNSGGNWTYVSGDLTGGGVLRSLAVAVGASNTIYSGSSDGRVYYTTNAAVWSPRYTGLPVAAIPDIVLDPGDALTAYLCADRSSGTRVFRTHDAGQTWTSLTGDLPSGPRAMSLGVDFRTNPPRLYLGTDYGVYSSSNEGAHWTKADTNFPNCAVYDIAVDPVNNYVVAATHGRGMWRAAPDAVAPAVAVTYPVGGEVWFWATTQNITWTASDLAGVDSVTIRLSTDGGTSYGTVIASGIPNSGSYSWTVPSDASTVSRVQVLAYDPSGNVGVDASDADFFIADPSQVAAEAGLPAIYALRPVVPNPVRPPAAIAYDLPRAERVSLEVFDPLGRRVRVLEQGPKEAGRYTLSWDGRDPTGSPVGNGVYFVRLKAGSFQQTRRVVVVR
jgi:photosystem II stability/assembly factor-like uncharacterized protein